MQGCVGMYWRGGRLLDRITPPGIHTRVPFLDTFEPIQVTMQTDKVTDIPCGTKGGVNITFDKIEVGKYIHMPNCNWSMHCQFTWVRPRTSTSQVGTTQRIHDVSYMPLSHGTCCSRCAFHRHK